MSDLSTLVDRMKATGATRVYAFGAVPMSPQYPYAVLTLSTGTPGASRAGGVSPRQRRYLTVQHFSSNADGLSSYTQRSDAAFQGQVIAAIPGRPYSWRTAGSMPDRDPDNSGVVHVTHVYTLEES